MKNQQTSKPEHLLVTPVSEPREDTRCIVCDRPSGGKAICGDDRCAAELARCE